MGINIILQSRRSPMMVYGGAYDFVGFVFATYLLFFVFLLK